MEDLPRPQYPQIVHSDEFPSMHHHDDYRPDPIEFDPFPAPVEDPGLNGDFANIDNMNHEQLEELCDSVGAVSKGYNQNEIERLGWKILRNCFDSDDNRKNCSVCLEDLTAGIRVLKIKCNHDFHEGCIREALKTDKRCPLCQKEAI